MFEFEPWARALGLPRQCSGKESAWSAGDLGSVTGSVKSPGEENRNSLQYSFLENSMERGAWWAIVHGVAKSQTRLINFHFCTVATLGNVVCSSRKKPAKSVAILF